MKIVLSKCFKTIFTVSLLLCSPIAVSEIAQNLETENWSVWLTEERDKVCYPDEVIRLAGIKEGDTVADIGAGPGYFTFRIGKTVGLEGKCFAVDFKYTGELADYINDKLHNNELNPYYNIFPIRNRYSDISLPEGSVDVALMYLTGLYLVDPEKYGGHPKYKAMHQSQKLLMESIYRALKPGGRLVMIDLIANEEEIREHEEAQEVLCCAATDPEQVKRKLEMIGFELEASYDLYQTQDHMDNIKDFRNSTAYGSLGKARSFLGREMFFFVFKKTEKN